MSTKPIPTYQQFDYTTPKPDVRDPAEIKQKVSNLDALNLRSQSSNNLEVMQNKPRSRSTPKLDKYVLFNNEEKQNVDVAILSKGATTIPADCSRRKGFLGLQRSITASQGELNNTFRTWTKLKYNKLPQSDTPLLPRTRGSSVTQLTDVSQRSNSLCCPRSASAISSRTYQSQKSSHSKASGTYSPARLASRIGIPKRQPWTYTNIHKKKSAKPTGHANEWASIINLEQLYNCGIIPIEEYKIRKRQLINSLTGTKIAPLQESIMKWSMLHRTTKQRRTLGEQTIVKEVPRWTSLPLLRAIRWSYNAETQDWQKGFSQIKVAPNPFTNGMLRYCFYMIEISSDSRLRHNMGALLVSKMQTTREPTHVCKVYIDPYEERDSYFDDAVMQAEAQRFADMYNELDVPKKVGFLKVSVYEILDKPGTDGPIICNVEEYIKGDYIKHNNNWDWCEDLIARNTPQTFSHYTYEASNRKLIVVDMQGVNDLYTDPQMHTRDKDGFGKGNLGIPGIEQFLKNHRCNAICQFLRLESRFYRIENAVDGTLPNKRYMNQQSVPTLLQPSTQATNIPPEEDYSHILPRLLKTVENNEEVEDKESNICFLYSCIIL